MCKFDSYLVANCNGSFILVNKNTSLFRYVDLSLIYALFSTLVNSERYGSKLSLVELNHFDVLKDDYEINWHLNNLRSIINPTKEEMRSRSVKIKNRRLAYMNKLMVDGSYFSEDAMREREPYLHHEYVGQFQDPSGRSMARPGERWSETLMRRSEEAFLLEKIRGEQQRLGVARSDWVGNEREMQEEESEEEESDEEEEKDKSETEAVVEKEKTEIVEDVEGVAAGVSTKSSQILEVKTSSLFKHLILHRCYYLLGFHK